jgi:arginine decarboxylase
VKHTQSGSNNQQARPASLLDAIKAHNAAEVASFHTPGHKGHAPLAEAKGAWQLDCTELPGLDDLAHPRDVLLQLQNRAADLWDTAASYVCVNGASGALMAALLACAGRGRRVLLPRHAHRSAINALVLTGLEPVWYEAEWLEDCGIFGPICASSFETALEKHADELACALVVSPTYSGHISDIQELANISHGRNVPLIVDEAHGAHLINGSGMPAGALACGADLVVHSAHKTLSALTQTGLVHIGRNSLVPPETVHASLNLLQTSSPSYLLLAALEQALIEATQPDQWQRLIGIRETFVQRMKSTSTVQLLNAIDSGFSLDPLHILLRVDGLTAQQLYNECCQWGVFPETVLGNGVLFLLGAGSRAYETEALADAIEHIALENRPSASRSENAQAAKRVPFAEQIISPRQAFLSPCETVSIKNARDRIAAECVAPCPPGIPVIVPGMRVSSEALESCPQTHLMVVVESGPRRT